MFNLTFSKDLWDVFILLLFCWQDINMAYNRFSPCLSEDHLLTSVNRSFSRYIIWNFMVGFEILIAVTVKRCTFWARMQCSPVKASWCFEEHTPPSSEFCLLPASCWFLPCLTHWPSRWRRCVPPKHWLTFTGLHGVKSQKIFWNVGCFF